MGIETQPEKSERPKQSSHGQIIDIMLNEGYKDIVTGTCQGFALLLNFFCLLGADRKRLRKEYGDLFRFIETHGAETVNQKIAALKQKISELDPNRPELLDQIKNEGRPLAGGMTENEMLLELIGLSYVSYFMMSAQLNSEAESFKNIHLRPDRITVDRILEVLPLICSQYMTEAEVDANAAPFELCYSTFFTPQPTQGDQVSSTEQSEKQLEEILDAHYDCEHPTVDNETAILVTGGLHAISIQPVAGVEKKWRVIDINQLMVPSSETDSPSSENASAHQTYLDVTLSSKEAAALMIAGLKGTLVDNPLSFHCFASQTAFKKLHQNGKNPFDAFKEKYEAQALAYIQSELKASSGKGPDEQAKLSKKIRSFVAEGLRSFSQEHCGELLVALDPLPEEDLTRHIYDRLLSRPLANVSKYFDERGEHMDADTWLSFLKACVKNKRGDILKHFKDKKSELFEKVQPVFQQHQAVLLKLLAAHEFYRATPQEKNTEAADHAHDLTLLTECMAYSKFEKPPIEVLRHAAKYDNLMMIEHIMQSVQLTPQEWTQLIQHAFTCSFRVAKYYLEFSEFNLTEASYNQLVTRVATGSYSIAYQFVAQDDIQATNVKKLETEQYHYPTPTACLKLLLDNKETLLTKQAPAKDTVSPKEENSLQQDFNSTSTNFSDIELPGQAMPLSVGSTSTNFSDIELPGQAMPLSVGSTSTNFSDIELPGQAMPLSVGSTSTNFSDIELPDQAMPPSVGSTSTNLSELDNMDLPNIGGYAKNTSVDFQDASNPTISSIDEVVLNVPILTVAEQNFLQYKFYDRGFYVPPQKQLSFSVDHTNQFEETGTVYQYTSDTPAIDSSLTLSATDKTLLTLIANPKLSQDRKATILKALFNNMPEAKLRLVKPYFIRAIERTQDLSLLDWIKETHPEATTFQKEIVVNTLGTMPLDVLSTYLEDDTHQQMLDDPKILLCLLDHALNLPEDLGKVDYLKEKIKTASPNMRQAYYKLAFQAKRNNLLNTVLEASTILDGSTGSHKSLFKDSDLYASLKDAIVQNRPNTLAVLLQHVSLTKQQTLGYIKQMLAPANRVTLAQRAVLLNTLFEKLDGQALRDLNLSSEQLNKIATVYNECLALDEDIASTLDYNRLWPLFEENCKDVDTLISLLMPLLKQKAYAEDAVLKALLDKFSTLKKKVGDAGELNQTLVDLLEKSMDAYQYQVVPMLLPHIALAPKQIQKHLLDSYHGAGGNMYNSLIYWNTLLDLVPLEQLALSEEDTLSMLMDYHNAREENVPPNTLSKASKYFQDYYKKHYQEKQKEVLLDTPMAQFIEKYNTLRRSLQKKPAPSVENTKQAPLTPSFDQQKKEKQPFFGDRSEATVSQKDTASLPDNARKAKKSSGK